jgi:hypothetical protein
MSKFWGGDQESESEEEVEETSESESESSSEDEAAKKGPSKCVRPWPRTGGEPPL